LRRITAQLRHRTGAGNHPAAATVLLRRALAAVVVDILEEEGEGDALLLSLR
jgi:hypothetical protein